MNNYFQLIRLCENTYKTFLESLKDALFDLKINNLSPIQALIILNLGENEVNVNDLVKRGYYGGTSVSYNLNCLVENGFMLSQGDPEDRRLRKISLSEKGINVFNKLSNVIDEQNKSVIKSGIDDDVSIYVNSNLKRIIKTIELFSYSV